MSMSCGGRGPSAFSKVFIATLRVPQSFETLDTFESQVRNSVTSYEQDCCDNWTSRISMASQPPPVHGLVGANGLAVLSLDRPKALNAMNLEMDLAFKGYLDDWSRNAAVKSVLVESTSSRAFSAGGDVKWITTAGFKLRGSYLCALEVFQAEYSLICTIARYPKPYVSLMDGVTMGFGIGLSGHGRFRVVTERTILAMPENAIGLFPDVGFAHLAGKSPGEGAVGAYLAITGARITNPSDALFVGVGTHYVPSRNLPALKDALLEGDLSGVPNEAVEAVLSRFSEEPEDESQLKRLLPAITSSFGGGKSILESIAALKEFQLSSDTEVANWAKGAILGIEKGAPFSLCVTQKHFSEVASGASSSGHEFAEIEGVMKTEHRLAVRMVSRNDFVEGVRAVLIDKDQNPKWQPKDLDDVHPADVESCFGALGSLSDELAV